MTVYVDELMATKPTRTWPYTQSCHMVATTETELHEFAAKLGLKRSWFQQKINPIFSHYDLTPNKRLQAIKLGAQLLNWPNYIKKHKEKDEQKNISQNNHKI